MNGMLHARGQKFQVNGRELQQISKPSRQHQRGDIRSIGRLYVLYFEPPPDAPPPPVVTPPPSHPIPPGYVSELALGAVDTGSELWIFPEITHNTPDYVPGRIIYSLTPNYSNFQPLKQNLDGTGGQSESLSNLAHELTAGQIAHQGALIFWPGYDLGTCIYSEECSWLDWTIAAVGVVPFGKAAALEARGVLAARGALIAARKNRHNTIPRDILKQLPDEFANTPSGAG